MNKRTPGRVVEGMDEACIVTTDVVVENERDVILRWRSGDKSAYELLVRRYMREAYMTALALTGNAEDARDLSQDAFIKAYQARESFDPDRKFAPWFYRILKNHCLNFLQRVRVRTEPLHYERDGGEERFASKRPTALESMEKEERARMLRAAVDALSPPHREVIVLKNFRGLSYLEMAELVDVPIGTVMSRLYYARKALKEIITKWEQEGVIHDAPLGDEKRGEVV